MKTMLSKASNFASTLCMNFYQSLTSHQFYKKVFESYSGLGINYILSLSLISSFICSVFMLGYINNFLKYFEHGVISENVKHMDYVLNQLPNIEYSNQKKVINKTESSPCREAKPFQKGVF